MVDCYPDWYEKYVGSASSALNRRKRKKFAKRVGIAENVAQSGTLNPDDTAAPKLCLVYLSFQEALSLQDKPLKKERFELLKTALNQTSIGTVHESFKRSYNLQAFIIADSAGIQTLSEEKFRSLHAEIPVDEMGTEQYYYLSNFAFRNNLLDVLDQAVAPFLTSRKHQTPDYLWLRIQTMRNILTKTVAEDDIVRLLNAITFYNYLRK